MLRVLAVLVLVSACTPSGLVTEVPAQAPSARSGKESSDAAPSVSEIRRMHGRRLAPPFGASAGVRRVSEPSDETPPAGPDVIAAVD